jgi:hypothetical protein
MNKVIVISIVAGVLVLAAVLVFLFLSRKPDLSAYLPLKEPRIVHRDRELVLEAKASGEPSTAVKAAFSALMKGYYSLKGVPKGGPGMKVPKARYEFAIDLSMPTAERFKAIEGQPWSVAAAIPVPEGTVLSETAAKAGANLTYWDYGDTAEILHLGSYETETATIERLEAFIKAQGYTGAWDHEEEYLRGPGVGFVQPKDYWTIVRYRVKK